MEQSLGTLRYKSGWPFQAVHSFGLLSLVALTSFQQVICPITHKKQSRLSQVEGVVFDVCQQDQRDSAYIKIECSFRDKDQESKAQMKIQNNSK